MDKKEILQIKTCELYNLLSVKCVDIMLAHKLISQIHDVIWYRYKLQHVTSSESRGIVRCSLEDARGQLNDTLYAMNLCSLDIVLVRWIAEYYDYETDGK